MEFAYAYTQANQPTAQLIIDLCTSFAQMLADDFEGRVAVNVDGINVVREPSK
jgi:hypothetical protein